MSLIDLPTNPLAAPRATWLRRLWDGPRSLAWRRVALAAITAAGSASLTVLYFNDPSAPHGRLRFPPCPFHALTGFYCPGCGSTRGLYHLLHGDVVGACRMNVLMVLCVPFLAYAYVSYAARICFPQSRWANAKRSPLKAHWIWSLLAVILLYWVMRNVPHRVI
jgi:hypothetical protein